MAEREGKAGLSPWVYVLRTIRRNRGRSALIIAGVAILITFFVLFASVGAGLQEYVEQSGEDFPFEGMGGRAEADYVRISTAVGEWTAVVTGVIAVVMAMTVGNTMLLSVTERTKEIGTLRAVGVSRSRIYQLVVMEAGYLTAVGFLVGALAGLSMALVMDVMFRASEGGGWYFAPASVNLVLMAQGLLLSVGIGTLVALVPAHRAASIDPVEALRYE